MQRPGEESESLAALLRASPSLAASLRGADRAAASDAPILLLGEAGTGRSALARAFHRASPRRGGALVEVDPGVVPSTLFESELFGHQVGAFTGAEQAVEGRVARAEGGTLVLDHVESLPLVAQPKLLRLLAERTYVPLGGHDRHADVRFIALGDAELPHRVRRGAFRQDLYYRLEVLAYRLPPLRERREDLPSICAYLLRDLAARFVRRPLRLSASAAAWMADYAWPGNLRELRNLLERALITSEDDELDPPAPVGASEARLDTLADVERQHILRTLAHTRGHQGRAAEILGISRKSLWERRKRFEIP